LQISSFRIGDETEKFNTLSSTWWKDDRDALLLMNSVRIPLIKTVAEAGARILDAGCGGGYLSEVCKPHVILRLMSVTIYRSQSV